MPTWYTKKQVAEITGMPARNVQYYTDLGIVEIENPVEGQGHHRQYSLSNLCDFALIAELLRYNIKKDFIAKVIPYCKEELKKKYNLKLEELIDIFDISLVNDPYILIIFNVEHYGFFKSILTDLDIIDQQKLDSGNKVLFDLLLFSESKKYTDDAGALPSFIHLNISQIMTLLASNSGAYKNYEFLGLEKMRIDLFIKKLTISILTKFENLPQEDINFLTRCFDEIKKSKIVKADSKSIIIYNTIFDRVYFLSKYEESNLKHLEKFSEFQMEPEQYKTLVTMLIVHGNDILKENDRKEFEAILKSTL